MKKIYDCIVWDWNGTLIDDVFVALNAVNDMLIKRQKPTITIEQYYEYFDTPISKFYSRIFTENEITFNTIANEFAYGYKKHLQKKPIFTGAPELLSQIKQSGCKQLIISSSNQKKVEDDIRCFELFQYFDAISGADNHFAQSKVQRANRVIEQLYLSDKNILVIGDTLHDYQMAQSLKADCVLSSCGHQGKEDLLSAGVPVIDDFLELNNLLF